jgi:uncharacterized protein YbjQ (UPF0145 family)
MKVIRHIGAAAFVAGLFTVVFIGTPWYVLVAADPAIPWWLATAIFCLLGGILIVLTTVALEHTGKTSLGALPPVTAKPSRILLLNSDRVPGRKIKEILGLVQGHTVFAIWIGQDLSAIVRLVLGGELTEYTEMMGQARDLATQRMLGEAEKLGADAIINVRYMTTSVIGSAAELLVYGTAVRCSKSGG